ncbi:MAG: FHA domain-containing protein [Chloroflexota bacterium]
MGEKDKSTMVFKTRALQTDTHQAIPPTAGTRTISESVWVLILRVVDSSETIELQVREAVTLGRTLETPDASHIDLSPHHAARYGVSRKHMTLRAYKSNLVVRDLNSTNGTAINDYRLPAHADMPLKTGDVLRMGKLKMRVILAAKTPAE